LLQGGSGISVRNIADIHEEELDECESHDLMSNDCREYLYVKMTARIKNHHPRSNNRRSRWLTLDELRPKLRAASLMETSLEEAGDTTTPVDTSSGQQQTTTTAATTTTTPTVTTATPTVTTATSVTTEMTPTKGEENNQCSGFYILHTTICLLLLKPLL
jgi:hypothetical protein